MTSPYPPAAVRLITAWVRQAREHRLKLKLTPARSPEAAQLMRDIYGWESGVRRLRHLCAVDPDAAMSAAAELQFASPEQIGQWAEVPSP